MTQTNLEPTEKVPYQLQELSQRHKNAISLLAQGIPRETVAAACEYTPEYITWLHRQPVCREYLRELAESVDSRMLAMYEQSCDAMSEVLRDGKDEDRLKAARMNMEVIGRLGRDRDREPPDPGADRLDVLADRLVKLLQQKRERTVDGEVLNVEIQQG